MADLLQTVKSNTYIKVALLLGIAYLLFKFYFNKEKFTESLETADAPVMAPQPPQQQPMVPAPQVAAEAVVQKAAAGQLEAEDLLPKYDEANDFAKQNPVSKLLKEQNFLISGYHMGINTVMQSNKMPFHDLRAAPPIPKENVGPFLQSSYERPVGSSLRQMIIN